MNPASRIWASSLAICLLAVVILSACSLDAAGIFLIIFIIVALASLASLLGFRLFFQLLHRSKPAAQLYWPAIIVCVPGIVMLNAFGLMCLFGALFALANIYELLCFSAIPMVSSLIGVAASVRQIRHYLEPKQPEEFLPDSWNATAEPINPQF